MTTLSEDDYPDEFPDVELALRELLAPVAKTVSVLVDWSVPTVRVQRIGGGEVADSTDEPIVSLRCYAQPTEDNPRASQRLARAVRNMLDELNANGGGWAANTALERADRQSGPVSTPFDLDPSVRVTELIYRVSVRD